MPAGEGGGGGVAGAAVPSGGSPASGGGSAFAGSNASSGGSPASGGTDGEPNGTTSGGSYAIGGMLIHDFDSLTIELRGGYGPEPCSNGNDRYTITRSSDVAQVASDRAPSEVITSDRTQSEVISDLGHILTAPWDGNSGTGVQRGAAARRCASRGRRSVGICGSLERAAASAADKSAKRVTATSPTGIS